jgi:hypothetical protein
MGALMSLWVSNVEALGHSVAVAVTAGALIGPAKTAGRFFELIFGRELHPLITSFISLGLMMIGFSILLGFGATFAGLMVFAVLYGMGDGIKTITMGTLPLALFGPEGFGARLGWIAYVREFLKPFFIRLDHRGLWRLDIIFCHGAVYIHGAWCAVFCKATISVKFFAPSDYQNFKLIILYHFDIFKRVLGLPVLLAF